MVKGTGPGGNKFVNRGTISSRAGITPPAKKHKKGTKGIYTQHSDASGKPISQLQFERESAGGPLENRDTPTVRSRKQKINRLKGGSLKARLANIRLANVYEPNFKPNPNVKSKPSDFGTKAQPPGAEPVKVRDPPKNKRSNKYMKKRIFGAAKKKEQLDHHVKNKESWDEIKREHYSDQPEPPYTEEMEEAEYVDGRRTEVSKY
tara:strand:- start:858 stop:1472 length:615 start_codon:yes stop_codon:yes gene_type:complete